MNVASPAGQIGLAGLALAPRAAVGRTAHERIAANQRDQVLLGAAQALLAFTTVGVQ